MWLLLFVMAINWDSLWKQFESEPIEPAKPFIQACLDPNIQYAAAFCGIQSAKTLSGADATFALLYGPQPLMLPAHIRGKTPMEVWLVSKSYQLCETQLETFRWRTPQDIWATEKDIRHWGLTKGDRYTYWLKPRLNCEDQAPIKLRLRTSKDPEAMRATPVLGLLNGDEAAYWPPRSIMNAMGRAIVARTKFIFTTSPRGKDYLYRTIALPGGWPTGVGSDPKVAAFGWSSAQNPYADKDHLKRLERLLGKEYAKQELDGLFTDAIGYVYGMFDRTIHMRKIPSLDPEHYPIRVGGIDPGIRDPYAAGIWCRDKDGVWWQVWEFHETGQSSSRVAPLLKMAQDEWKVKAWYCDKRSPSAIQDLRDAGVKAYANLDIHYEKESGTIAPMVAMCRELMRSGKIFIDENHEWTAEEFEKYHYPDDVDEREKNTRDVPVDWMNHHCITGDSWVDCVDGRFQIKDLVGKDSVYVWAFDGEIPKAALASNIRKTRDLAPVVKVTFDNAALTLTADHLVMLKSGQWVEAGKLKYGDRVRALYKSLKENYVCLRTGRGRSRYEYAHRLVWESVNGPIPSGYHVHHRDENKLNNHPSNLELLYWKDHVAHHHDDLVKAAAASRRGVSPPSKTVPRESVCAYCEKVFTDTNIKARARKTCSKACWTGLRIHNHKVISVEPHGFADVYDMEVDAYHNFVANGVCVHNCDQMRYAICSVEDVPDAPPRYRQGASQVPKALGHEPPKDFGTVTVKDYLSAQNKRFEEREKGGGRQERRNRPVRSRLGTRGLS